MSNAGTETTADAASDEQPARSDLRDAVAWTALGVVTLIGSIRMDRLTQQNINPVTIPGLLPGLLALAMILLGLVLGLRSVQRGALVHAVPAASALQRAERRRVAIAIGLCLGYSVVLIGRGLPFWLGSSVYVTASILVFRRISPDPVQRHLGVRAIVQALVIGIGASVVTWLVFERLFLVRLP